jgi:hypothetical protein
MLHTAYKQAGGNYWKEEKKDLRAGRAISWFSLLYLTISATLLMGHSSNDSMNAGMQMFLKSQSFKRMVIGIIRGAHVSFRV